MKTKKTLKPYRKTMKSKQNIKKNNEQKENITGLTKNNEKQAEPLKTRKTKKNQNPTEK